MTKAFGIRIRHIENESRKMIHNILKRIDRRHYIIRALLTFLMLAL